MLPAIGTASIVVWLIGIVDRTAAAMLPGRLAFEQVVGFGVVFFLLLTVGAGVLVKGAIGAARLARWEALLRRLPIVRPLHAGAKQIVETAVAKWPTAFREICLVEYPRRGIWTIAAIAGAAEGELPAKTGHDDLVALLIPTTPNPITGLLVFVPRRDLRPLTLGLEDATKLVMSAGLVGPFDQASPRDT
jgi:uncharacterized membrane protein